MNTVKKELGFHELDIELQIMSKKARKRYPKMEDLFMILLNTGCTPEELFAIKRWNVINNSHVTLRTIEHRKIRRFKKSKFPKDYISSIKNKSFHLYNYNINSLRDNFIKLFPFKDVTLNGNPADLSLFRWHYIQNLYTNNWSYQNISTYLGNLGINEVKKFIKSEILCTTPLEI